MPAQELGQLAAVLLGRQIQGLRLEALGDAGVELLEDARREQLDTAAISTPFESFPSPGTVDQYSSHRFGSGSKEMPPAVPVLGLLHVHQP